MSRNARPFEVVDFATFSYWAQASDVQLSTALTLSHFERPGRLHGVRGVRTTRSVRAGETLIRVPASAMLVNSSQVLQLHGVRSSVLLEPSVAQRVRRACDACGLMSFVMLDEQRALHTSRWQPYLHMLELDPSLKSSHPMCVAATPPHATHALGLILSRLCRLLSTNRLKEQAPNVRFYVVEARRRMRACYEAVFGIDDSRVVAIVGGIGDPAPQFSYSKYIDASLKCAAHHFGVAAGAAEGGEERFLALIPGADLFAAPAEGQTPQAHLRRVPGSLSPLIDDYIVESLSDIRVGTEVTADWFPRLCLEEQLCSYGYVYDSKASACEPVE